MTHNKKELKYCCKKLEKIDKEIGGVIVMAFQAATTSDKDIRVWKRSTLRESIKIKFCPFCGKKVNEKD